MNKLKYIIKHTLRGRKILPYVGYNPGNIFLPLCLFIATASGGFLGLQIMSTILIPFYLYQSYSRSVLSDSLQKKYIDLEKY